MTNRKFRRPAAAGPRRAALRRAAARVELETDHRFRALLAEHDALHHRLAALARAFAEMVDEVVHGVQK